MSSPPTTIHPDIAALAFLVGRWSGEGRGDYPTIDSFAYREQVEIVALPKPLLRYSQRTADAVTGEPLHLEAGWFRMGDGSPELTIAQPTGITETYAGSLSGQRLVLHSTGVLASASAGHHHITAVRRDLEVSGQELRYTLAMAAVGQPLQTHLVATLRREPDPGTAVAGG